MDIVKLCLNIHIFVFHIQVLSLCDLIFMHKLENYLHMQAISKNWLYADELGFVQIYSNKYLSQLKPYRFPQRQEKGEEKDWQLPTE